MKSTGYISRASFMRGDLRGLAVPIRPPWAIEESLFDDACSNCGKCIESCAESILVFGRGKLPVVDFQKGECSFCGDCVNSCETVALSRNGKETPWNLVAEINDKCLVKQAVMCRTCGDVCDARAIHFQLAIGGFSTPELNLSECTGCGACVAPCPTQAISMREASFEADSNPKQANAQ
jgi:ferredoxin-type protein NapF